MDTFEKQPYEEFTIQADFSANMAEGETVLSATATAIIQGGALAEVVTDATPTGQAVTAIVAGGEDGTSYIITIRAITSADSKWEIDIKMKVKS